MSYRLMLVWAGLLALGVWTRYLPLWTPAALAALNTIMLWTYATEKNAARAGRWHIPESQSHMQSLSLLLSGGWPAAWLAQQNMRHKTSNT